MSGFPDPLTPHDCDLRGMPYMPVDLVRLFDSDLFALSTGDEFKAAFTLWGKAFLQVPAGSIPDDDRILAHLSGAGRLWTKFRSMALRGWIKCSDGRLYHPVVAAKALSAWEGRIAQKARTEAARAARAANRGTHLNGSAPPVAHSPTRSVTPSVTDNVADNVTGSKGEGELSKEERKTPHTPRKRGAVAVQEFAEFWKLYPRKVGKGAAERAWTRALAECDGDADPILMGLKVATSLDRLDMREEGRFCPHPSTWLNGKRWLDGMDAEPDCDAYPSHAVTH